MRTKLTCLSLLVFSLALLIPIPSDADDSPHWNKDGCQTCHSAAAPLSGSASLNEPDAEALCETCHGDRGAALQCRHMSGIPIGPNQIPEKFANHVVDGKIECSTCHDIVYQCENAKPQYSFMNPAFLRDRSTLDPGAYCLECHDTSAIEVLNPHGGVAGTPPRPTCLLCHGALPEADEVGELVVSFNMQSDLDQMCIGCHRVGPHPRSFSYSSKDEGWVHLVAPSAETLENMRESQAESGIELPLNPQNQEVFCATCHNPHDFKVGGQHGSEESEIAHRLRRNSICQACHDK